MTLAVNAQLSSDKKEIVLRPKIYMVCRLFKNISTKIYIDKFG